MKDLVSALTILATYTSDPPAYEDGEMVVSVRPELVLSDEKAQLEQLGFHADDENDCFVSWRFGGCA